MDVSGSGVEHHLNVKGTAHVLPGEYNSMYCTGVVRIGEDADYHHSCGLIASVVLVREGLTTS